MAKKLNASLIERLLVIVPHQDDEILIGAGLIYELLRQKKEVTAAIVTNGDYECGDFSKGRLRLRETLKGLGTLGLSEEHIVFLGYADTGMPRKDSFLMKLYKETDNDKVHPSSASSFTYGLEEKQDFHYLRCGEHGAYTRGTLTGDILELFRRVCPDTVLTTHCSDMHGDHEALFYLVREALKKWASPIMPRLLTGIIHSPEGDDTWPLRGTKEYTCPKGLEEQGLKWDKRLILPLRDEFRCGKTGRNLKYEALEKYETALEPGAVDYLMAFVKEEEIFWEIEKENV